MSDSARRTISSAVSLPCRLWQNHDNYYCYSVWQVCHADSLSFVPFAVAVHVLSHPPTYITFPSRALRRIYVGAVYCPSWSVLALYGAENQWPSWFTFTNRFAGVIRQVCHLSRRGLTFTLWYFFTKCGKTWPLRICFLLCLHHRPLSMSVKILHFFRVKSSGCSRGRYTMYDAPVFAKQWSRVASREITKNEDTFYFSRFEEVFFELQFCMLRIEALCHKRSRIKLSLCPPEKNCWKPGPAYNRP